MKEQDVSSVSVARLRQVWRAINSGREYALRMEVFSFVYKETPFCRLCNIAQTKIGDHFESVVPRNRSEPNEGQMLSNFYQFKVIGGIRPCEARFPAYSDSTKSSVSKRFSGDAAVV